MTDFKFLDLGNYFVSFSEKVACKIISNNTIKRSSNFCSLSSLEKNIMEISTQTD